MEHSTFSYNDQFFPYPVNNDGRQNIEQYSEQDSHISAEPAGTDLRAVSYGSIHPLALSDPESKQFPRNHDAAFNYTPGMSLNQQLPSQRYPPGGSAFGTPDQRYDPQTHHPLPDGFIVNAHASYNFGNQPKPSSNFANYLEGQLPRTVETRTLPSSLASPGMPPGSSSSATLSPISPSLGHPPHEAFSSPLGSFSRHELAGHHHSLNDLPPSPHSHYLPMSASRNPLSGQYGGYSSAMDMDTASNSSRGGSESLPFQETKTSMPVCDGRQRTVNAEIHAKIDKGFFQAEGDWTCYRRNYFAVACSYKLKLDNGAGDATGPFYIRSKQGRSIDKFAMCIAACIDNDETKNIELVQHTPKRDKGPQTTPDKKILNPNPSGQLGSIASSSVGAYPPSSPFGSHPQDAGYYAGTPSITSPPPPPPADEQQSTTYERIQFKKATANNGKRRAAQQYFYILVELYAGFRKPASAAKSSTGVSDFEWHKVAIRMSAQMVVRGRSPGHYSDTQRPSSSMGPGMGGNGGPGGYYPMSGASHASMGGSAYGPNRMHTTPGFSHGGGGYSNRGMMQMAENLELVPSLSSCSTLDDSSVSGDGNGNAPMPTQSPFGMNYNNGMSQVSGMMSPPFSLPSSSAPLSTHRPQMLPSSNYFKASPGPPSAEYKPEPLWQRRNDYQQGMYPGQRYENNMGPQPGYLNNNESMMRDCRPSWQAPLSDGSRSKWEPMST